jgi:hypothetical protein
MIVKSKSRTEKSKKRLPITRKAFYLFFSFRRIAEKQLEKKTNDLVGYTYMDLVDT